MKVMLGLVAIAVGVGFLANGDVDIGLLFCVAGGAGIVITKVRS